MNPPRVGHLPCCGFELDTGQTVPHIGSTAMVRCERCGRRGELTRRTGNIDARELVEAQ